MKSFLPPFLKIFFLAALLFKISSAQELTCADQVLAAIMAGNQNDLVAMAVGSGKNINDLGEYDFCIINEGTTFATIQAFPFPLYMGICLPNSCNSGNSGIIQDAVTQLLFSMGIPAQAMVVFPDSEPPKVNTRNIIGFIGFGFLILLCIMGIIVEYTNIFGRNEDEKSCATQQDKTLVESKNFPGKILLAFSFSRNLRKMFWTPQRSDDYLTIFNGLRVISMAYIIFGHIHESFEALPIINPESIATILTSWYGVFVMGAFYSVDTFFFLSAFLGAYLMIPKLMKVNIVGLWMIYVHRFIRIIPTLGLFIALMLTFVNFLGSGPLWYFNDMVLVQPCQKYWWTILTFSNNFYPNPPEIPCLTILWYISNDMMFFMVLPIVVLLYCRNKIIGYSLTLMLILANIIIVFVISAKHHHSMAKVKDTNNTEIYHTPYSRFGAYFVGCLFGMFYYEWKKAKTNSECGNTLGAIFYNRIEQDILVRTILQLIGAGVILFLVMITYTEIRDPEEILWPQMASNFFNALHRPFFVLGLALFLAGPMVGKSRFIRFILGGSAWAPWAKITFIVYLVHDILITWFYTQTRQALYLTTRVAIYYWFAALILSYLVAIPVTLLIESPILQLEKLLLFPQKQKKVEVLTEEELDEKEALFSSEVNSETTHRQSEEGGFNS